MNIPEKDFVAKRKRFISVQDGGGLGFVVGGNCNDAIVVDVYFDGKPTVQNIVVTPHGAIKLAHALAEVANYGNIETDDKKENELDIDSNNIKV
jgi:hypothetical protein